MVQEPQQTDQLVVIGASAGGVEALSTLVATLPADFPAPIVVAQHLDPRRPSQLVPILARRSVLPVRAVEDWAQLTPGVIFVVPANRHVEIEHDTLRLTADGRDAHKPSVDRLFRSAAQAYDERLIAVVLTGLESDGSAGAQVVKAAGGTVIIQNPHTARFPSMPASLAPAIVDIVADLEQIGPLLHDLVTGAYLPSRADQDRTLRTFLDQVRAQSGIDFTSYKMPTIQRSLQRRVAAMKMQRLAEYIHYVEHHPEEYQRLINSFLIKVTEFFRDPELYAYLRKGVIPQLIAEARSRGNELRIWSAGCATGEEAYSIAILVAEALGDQLDRFTVRIFATDLDAGAITVARRGVYPAAALVGMPADLLERYFTPINNMYEIKKKLRMMTVFGQHDLARRPPFPRIDLCICRNVLIYFTAELQARTLQLFAFSLRDGGVLVLGKSETISPVAEFFRDMNPQLKIFRRHGERLLIPSSHFIRTPPPAARAVDKPLAVSNPRAERQAATVPGRTARDELARCLLELPIGVVVVDRRYDIQLLNGAASRLLGLQDAAIGRDLIHLAQGLSPVQLRAAIDAAFQPDAPRSGDDLPPGAPPIEQILQVESGTGEGGYLQIGCYPYAGTSRQDDRLQMPAAEELVLVTVVDVSSAERERQEQHERDARQARAIAELTERGERLTEINRDLLRTNQRLVTINIELRSASEEATIDSEEAQTATEEVETLNEELQASNEELETLNEELQASNEELETTNDELQARSAELREQTVVLNVQQERSEAERLRLLAILSGLGDAVLVVDPAGQIVLTNHAYDNTFGSVAISNMADADGTPIPEGDAPQARAARGESFSMQFTQAGTDGKPRWFEAYGERVHFDDVVDWGVVVIRDITERSLRRLQEEFVANVSHGLQTPITVIRASLGLLSNGAASRLTPEERDLIESAREQTEQLRGQIEDLLTANQVRAGTLQIKHSPIDLREIATDVLVSLRLLFEEKQQSIALDLPEPLPVLADARRMEQVLVNLLTNANRHTPPGTNIEFSGRRSGDSVLLALRDHGPGVPAEHLEAIFEPFRRLGDGRSGSGLGLSIARTLISLHGGALWAERPADEGIIFYITLPLHEGDEEFRVS